MLLYNAKISQSYIKKYQRWHSIRIRDTANQNHNHPNPASYNQMYVDEGKQKCEPQKVNY